jgi:hypothetical protein
MRSYERWLKPILTNRTLNSLKLRLMVCLKFSPIGANLCTKRPLFRLAEHLMYS